MTVIKMTVPMTFIKDIPGIEKLRPDYVEALDSFLFEWPTWMLPFYEEFKRMNADIFECLNVSTCGIDWAQCYENNGYHYRFDITP